MYFFKNGKKEFILDKKDKLILTILQHDGRVKFSDLAAKISLSPEGVKYRIKQLEKQKIIERYSIVINYDELAYKKYFVVLKCDNIKLKEEEEFANFLKSRKYVLCYDKVLNFLGAEYILTICVKSDKELRSIIRRIRKDFEKFVLIYSVISVYETHQNGLIISEM